MPAYNRTTFISGTNSASGFLIKSGPIVLQYVNVCDAVGGTVKLYNSDNLSSGTLVASVTAAATTTLQFPNVYLDKGLRVTTSASTALAFIYS